MAEITGAEDKVAGQEELEQTGDADGRAFRPEEAVPPAISMYELTERKHPECIRSAKEAEELAEEEEYRRIW